MSKNPLFCNGEENESDPESTHRSDHYQKLTTSRGSPLAHARRVW